MPRTAARCAMPDRHAIVAKAIFLPRGNRAVLPVDLEIREASVLQLLMG
jgi:hypothetical protein